MRISTQILLFFIMMNAAANLLVVSGVASDWGIAPDVGGDDALIEAEQTAEEVQASRGTGSTLFTVFSLAADFVRSVYAVVFAGPVMLENAGVPGWLTTFVAAPLQVIVSVDVLYALSGRDI